MGERTIRFCDECDKNINDRGFVLKTDIEALNPDQDNVKAGDYCSPCLGKKLGMTPDVLQEIMQGLDEVLESQSASPTPNIVEVVCQSLDDLANIVDPSEETKQKFRDLGQKAQDNWTALSNDLQARFKKVFNVDDSDPEDVEVKPKEDSTNSNT